MTYSIIDHFHVCVWNLHFTSRACHYLLYWTL